MPLTYLDSSGLVKRYVPEAGSAWVTHIRNTEPVAISLVAVVEIASAIARRRREGSLTEEQASAIYRLFVAGLASCVVIGVHQEVIQRAATFLLTAPAPIRLRSLDANHMASAQLAFDRARRRGIAVGAFVSSDIALLAAARWSGLAIENPEQHP